MSVSLTLNIVMVLINYEKEKGEKEGGRRCICRRIIC